jgi:hypothetical protein
MACYNSELPIGPPGPTGPQGPIGLSSITRVFNDTTTTALDGALNEQVLNFSLEEDGQFIEVDFSTVSLDSGNDYSSCLIELNGIRLSNINVGDDITKIYQGTITITRKSLTAVNIRYYFLSAGIGEIDTFVGTNISSTTYYNQLLSQTADPINLVLTISTQPGSGDTELTTSNILKYNVPYL